METQIRSALVNWLRTAPTLSGLLNTVEEETPLSISPPWLGIAASASSDWSTKDRRGHEVRIALELHTRGDGIASDGALIGAIMRRIESLPHSQPDFDLVASQFLRARAERRELNVRVVLIEYRFRLLETQSAL